MAVSHTTFPRTGNSRQLIAWLCQGLEQLRLDQNVTQRDLAAAAGVSQRTMTRLSAGEEISLDSIVRVMIALGLRDHIANLLPPVEVQPIQSLEQGRNQRKRSSRPTRNKDAPVFVWGDGK